MARRSQVLSVTEVDARQEEGQEVCRCPPHPATQGSRQTNGGEYAGNFLVGHGDGFGRSARGMTIRDARGRPPCATRCPEVGICHWSHKTAFPMPPPRRPAGRQVGAVRVPEARSHTPNHWDCGIGLLSL